MQIFNIGPLELIIILIIMFILLGPKEMVITAQRIGKWIRNLVRSPAWREIMGYSQEIRELPKKIMEDTGLEETLKEVRASTQAAATEINTAVSASMQEIRQTSQEAAAEMNQAVKESVEAARVPEVEHLRLDTGTDQTIAPPGTVETPAVVETSGVEPTPQLPAETADTAIPAVVDVAEVNTPEAELPKKPRRKRVQAAVEPAVSVEPAADQPAVETPKPARRTRARKPAVETQDSSMPAPEEQAPLNIPADLAVELPPDPTMANNGSETAAPKKRRVKRVEPPTEEKQALD